LEITAEYTASCHCHIFREIPESATRIGIPADKNWKMPYAKWDSGDARGGNK